MTLKHIKVKDKFGRKVNYLRISITDRCNLRCIYCSPLKNFKFLPHKEILTYEEIIRLIEVGRMLGIEKVRLTGGEPFVRKRFLSFLEKVLNKFPEIDLRITTNGTLLTKDIIKRLKDIGIKIMNVSLDTFDEKKFMEITKKDLHKKVMDAIFYLMDIGINTKINVVALRHINSDEVLKFAEFAYKNPVHVRFIEFMNISGKNMWTEDYFYSAKDILSIIEREYKLERIEVTKATRGPARMYKIIGGIGKVGIISPLSDHFCFSCNRFRITADGRLKTCLFSQKDYRLKPVLRNPKLGEKFLYRIMSSAVSRKPIGKDIILNTGLVGMYKVGG